MSAIAVVVDRSGGMLDIAGMERLVAEMAWRGSDQRGTWHDRSAGVAIGLGATQFWTTPEGVGSAQPVVDTAYGCTVVLDGRIDNRPELCATLGLPAARARHTSDAALVLAAYRRWGRELTAEVVGAYTAAIWDGRRGELFAARDALGHRPLYYRVEGDVIYAASSLVALRTVPVPTSELDEDYVWDFVCTNGSIGSFDPEATPFRRIRRLPPGHTLTVSARAVRVERWWRPWELPSLHRAPDGELVERFRTTFADVVQAQLRATGPVAATLSGGLDSSAIVCMARHLERIGASPAPPVHAITTTWSASSGHGEYDERAYVDAVLERHPGPWHEMHGEELGELDYFRADRLERGEPFSQFGNWWSTMASIAAEQGSRVLLTGNGGDTVVGGNAYYLAELLRRGKVGALVRALRGHACRGGTPYPLMVGSFVVAPFLAPHRGEQLARVLTKRADRSSMDSRYPWTVPLWVADAERQRRRGPERVGLLGPRRFHSPAAQHDYEAIVTGSSDHVRGGFDDVALRSGVELREPFYDSRLVELSLQLPATLKFDAGLTKVVLRRALADLLPTALRTRRNKTTYSFALTDEIDRHGELVESLLADSAAVRHGFVDRAVALELITSARQGGGGEMPSADLLTLLSLEDWLTALEADDLRRPSAGAARPDGHQTDRDHHSGNNRTPTSQPLTRRSVA